MHGQYNIEEDGTCVILRREGDATPAILELLDPLGKVRGTLQPCASINVELGVYDMIITAARGLFGLETEWRAAHE